MKQLLKRLPFIVLIVLELAVGIMLFVEPELFTHIVIMLFGCALIGAGILQLINYLRGIKKSESYAFTLTISVVLMLIGLLITCFAGMLYKLLAFPVIIYGIMLAIFGIYKIGFFFDMKIADTPLTMMVIINGIITVICGAVITCKPLDVLDILWRAAGIAHIVMAVADCVALFLKPRADKKPAVVIEADKQE